MPRIAVVGGGPAGLAFAAAMADTRLDIEVLERAPSVAPVGSGFVLQPSGLQVASALNIREALEAKGHRIQRILGYTADRDRRVIDVDYAALGRNQYALGLHRAALVDALRSRIAQSHIPIITATDIRAFERSDDGVVWLQNAEGQQWGPYDLVVDASGSRSYLRGQLFADSPSTTLEYGSLWGTFDLPDGLLPPHTLLQRFGNDNASMGLMPLGAAVPGGSPQVAFFWNIRCATYPAWLAAGLPTWKQQVLELWPDGAAWLEQVQTPEQLTLAQWQHHLTPEPLRPGIVLIGDAAHATSPQLGQGVNLSLLDALALSAAIRQQTSLDCACRAYAVQRRHHVNIVQRLAKALIPFYQTPNRVAIAVRNLLLPPVFRLPMVRRLVARLIAGLIGLTLSPPPIRHARTHNKWFSHLLWR